jgi:hypothetical protein
MRFLGNRSAGGRTIHLCPLQRTPGASRNWPWDIINILRAILGESSDKSNSTGLTSPGDDSLAPTSNGTHQRRHLGHILVCPAQFLEAKYRVNIDKQKTTRNIEKKEKLTTGGGNNPRGIFGAGVLKTEMVPGHQRLNPVPDEASYYTNSSEALKLQSTDAFEEGPKSFYLPRGQGVLFPVIYNL